MNSNVAVVSRQHSWVCLRTHGQTRKLFEKFRKVRGNGLSQKSEIETVGRAVHAVCTVALYVAGRRFVLK